MGTIANATATLGLIARGTPTGISVTGTELIGTAAKPTALESDICYSLTITATGAGDVATLDLTTGAVTQTTGTPSVARRAGEINNLAGTDFEGAPIPTASFINSTLFSSIGHNNTVPVVVASSDTSIGTGYLQDIQGSAILSVLPLSTGTGSTVTFTFGDSGDSVTITIAAKV